MKVLLMKKDGIIHKVSELNKQKVQDKLDAGFVIVGSEDLDAPDEVSDAVAKAVKALNIDDKIAKAVADAVNKAVEKAVTEAVKKMQKAEQTATQEPKK
jgi:hypothetical protein